LVFLMIREYLEHVKEAIDSISRRLEIWYKFKRDAKTLSGSDIAMYNDVVEIINKLKADLVFLERYVSNFDISKSDVSGIKRIEDKINLLNESLKTYFSSLESYLKKLSSDLELLEGKAVIEAVESVRPSSESREKKVERVFVRPSEKLGMR